MGKIFPWPIWIVAFFCIFTQGIFLPSARGFAILGTQDFTASYHWSDAALAGGLTFAVAPDFSTQVGDPSAVRNAFDSWSEGSTALNFTESNFAIFGYSQGANIDIMAMPSAIFNFLGYSGALAVTLVGAYNGQILGADILFNKDYSFSENPTGNEFDIESIALHEIGHAIGLDHPDIADDIGRNYDSSGASITASGLEVMNSTIAPGAISRVLTSDEIAALNTFFPSPPGLVLVTSVSSVTVNPTPTPEPGTLVLLGIGLAGLIGFRRRYRFFH